MLNFLKRWAFNVVQKEIGEWGDKTFPYATPTTIIKHLQREVKELADSHHSSEVADCTILLFQIAHRYKYSLYNELIDKMNINRDRKWGKPDADGVVEHID